MARKLLPLFTSAVCGLLLAWPFRTYDGALPVWFVLAPMFWLMARLETTRQALLCAGVFALCWTCPAFTFLWPLTPPGMLALCIYISLCYCAALLVVRWLARRGMAAAVFGTAALWALVEAARANVPVLAFPWLLLGHTLLHNEHLRQGADLLGVYGLSFLMAAVNAALAFALPAWLPPAWQAAPGVSRASARRVCVPLAALLVGAFLYGAARIAQIEPQLQEGFPIGVIQGNVAQKLGRSNEELDAQFRDHLALHRQLAQENPRPALICWAETMVPGCINADEWGQEFERAVEACGVETLAGSNYYECAADPNEEGRCYNGAFLLHLYYGKEQDRYLKRRLVPFGEYIPFAQRFPFLRALRSVTRDQYTPGTRPSWLRDAPQAPGAYLVAVNICVEDIHPDLAREAVLAGADTLINLTNDGWFYGTYGPRSHLQAAAWRAIETRRPLLRVTNTGYTVAVDPLGRIELLVPNETRGSATVRLKRAAPRGGGGTVFGGVWTLALWLGDGGEALLLLGILLASLGRRGRCTQGLAEEVAAKSPQ